MPNAVLDSVATPPGVAVVINVLANDVGSGLNIISVTSPLTGSVVVNPDQTLTYTPEPEFVGEDSFNYVVRDSSQITSQGEVRVVVGEGNHSPTPVSDKATVVTGGFVDIDVLANDNDPDGDPLQIAALSMPGHGVVQLRPDSRIRYVPQSRFVGSDSFVYGVSDGKGPVTTTVVSIKVLSTNDAPVVVDDAVWTYSDTPVTIGPLANDNDPDGDLLQISSLTLPPHGRLALNANQSLIYTPSEGYIGLDTFTYTASDGRGGTMTAQIEVDVRRRNETPVANSDVVMVEAGSPATIDLLSNDTDADEDPIALKSLTLPQHGQLGFNPDQTLVYTPHPGFVGLDSFTYVISDSRGATATGQVNVTVNASSNQATFVNGYRYRRRLVIPSQTNEAGSSLDFVMRVDQSGSWLRSVSSGGKVISDQGLDIRFELQDGTKLAHEVEGYDPDAGQLRAWVRIPGLQTGGPGSLLLYYGKPGIAADESDPAGTWLDYLAVWDARTGSDRSGNGHDLAMTSVGQGNLLGDAGHYNSTSRGILADTSWLDGHAALTVQTWIDADAQMIGSDRGIVSQGDITGADETQGFGLRYDASGFFGGATNAILWQVNTSGGWTRVESARNVQKTGPTYVVGSWQNGEVPTLYLQGEESPSSNVPDLRSGATSMGAGPITFGAAGKDQAGSGWRGLIDEVRVRATAVPPELVRMEYTSHSAPELFYGTGDEETPNETVSSVVALPITRETPSGQRVDIDLSVLMHKPDGGQQPTVTSLGTPANGIVSTIDGKIRYTPTGGFVGTDVFTYTLTLGDTSSTGYIRILVKSVSTGASGWDWSFEPPRLPSDRSKVKTWMIGQQSLESISLSPDDVLLGVLPEQAYTGTVTWKTPEIPCPFVLVGGEMAPKPTTNAWQYNRDMPGLSMLFRWRMRQNATYMGGPPFYFLSHLHVDWAANNVTWADFMRGGMRRPSNFANMPTMYWQNLYFNSGCLFFNNDESVYPNLAEFQPHSDIFQPDAADTGICNIGRCRFEWRAQGFFPKPDGGFGAYHIGQEWNFRDCVFHPRARPSYHPASRKIEYIKPYNQPYFDYSAGLYPAFTFNNTYLVIDPDQTNELSYISPTSGIGGAVSYNSNTRRYSFPMQGGGPNPSPVYSGEVYAVDRGSAPVLLTKDDVGLSYQIRSVDSLYEAFGQS